MKGLLLIVSLVLLLSGCGGGARTENAEDAVKDPEKVKTADEDAVADDKTNVGDQGSVSEGEVTNLADTEVVPDVGEIEALEAEDAEEVEEEVAAPVESPAIESEVDQEDSAPRRKHKRKDRHKHAELAGPFCPAFVESKSELLMKWIERVETMTLPELGKHAIAASVRPIEAKREDYQEYFQKIYTIQLPEHLDVLDGNSGQGYATFEFRDTQHQAVTCVYQGKDNSSKKKRCSGAKSSYQFSYCGESDDHKRTLLPGDKFEATEIKLRVNEAAAECAATKVEMVLKLHSAESPRNPGCGDVITESVQLRENLKCAKEHPVALTILGDGLTLKGKRHSIEVANDKRTAILILGQRNKIRRVTLRGNKPGLGIVAYEETQSNQCKRIKEVIPEMSSMGFPQSLFHRIGTFFAFLVDSIRQILH